MSRCWGCCQENCGYSRCSCDCHETVHGKAKVEEVKARPPVQVSPVSESTSTRQILPIERPCRDCGTMGAHYCTGKTNAAGRVTTLLLDELRNARRASIAMGQCPDHKRYQAKRKPRSNCEGCWRIWIALNPR